MNWICILFKCNTAKRKGARSN